MLPNNIYRSEITATLAQVKLTERQRGIAEDLLSRGERFANLVIVVVPAFCAAMQRLERGLRALFARKSTN